MSAFLNQQLTNGGWDALSIALGGGRLTFYKMQAGSGSITNDAAIPAMTSLVAPVCDLAITSYVIEGDGQITLFGNISSAQLDAGFTFKELGVFATIEQPIVGKGGTPSGPNIQAIVQTPSTLANPVVPPPAEGTPLMYSYCNSYDASDYIPGSGETTDVVNTVQVTIKIDQAPDVQINILQGQTFSVANIGAPSVGAGPWSYTQANVGYFKRLVPGAAMLITEDTNTITIGQRQLTADLDLYVANGNPDISPNFSTIQKALDYLGQWLIPTTIQARIWVSAGVYNLTSAVNVSHPNGRSITIQGPQNATLNATSISSITGSTKNWSVTYAGIANTSSVHVNDYVIVDGTGGVTSANQALLCGFFKVTAVTANSVTLLVPYNKASFGVTGLNAARLTPITAIHVAPKDVVGFLIGSYGLNILRYVGVVAAALPSISNTSGIICNGAATMSFCGCYGYDTVNNAQGTVVVHGILVGANGNVQMHSCASTKNQNGITTVAGGIISHELSAVSHNNAFGFWVASGQMVFVFGWSHCGGNGNLGIYITDAGFILCHNTVPSGNVIVHRNDNNGMYIVNKGLMTLSGGGSALVQNNAGAGNYDVYVANYGMVTGSGNILGSRIFNLTVGQMSATGGLIN
jgi:hypothetical protein